jgi:oligopeptide/dipeptide ABC transporter ATP-binding protein
MGEDATGVIVAKDLCKYFKTTRGELRAVDGVSFSIDSGMTLGVVGESGCGKTTLGRTVINLIPPTQGKVYYKGTDVFSLGKREMRGLRTKINIIFQDPYSSLDPRMTVAESIAEPMMINRMYDSRAQMGSRVRALMDTVGLAHRVEHSYPHELDGGMRQRVGIARALAVNPEFLVCDEPVSALDVSIQAQILNLLMDLQRELKLTYMFITHDLSVVRHISKHILVMYLGKAVEMSDSDSLFASPLHPYTKALLAAIPVPSLASIGKEPALLKGEISSPINLKPGCRFCSRCDFAMDRCGTEEPELVEISTGRRVACFLYVA